MQVALPAFSRARIVHSLHITVRTTWLHRQTLTFELSQIIDGLSYFFQGLIHVQCMQVQLEDVVDLCIPAAQACHPTSSLASECVGKQCMAQQGYEHATVN